MIRYATVVEFKQQECISLWPTQVCKDVRMREPMMSLVEINVDDVSFGSQISSDNLT